jgi:hypothetical protein
MKKNFLTILCFLALSAKSQSIFPLKISESRRYFVTQQNKPFLYHADTGWQIFSRLTTAEAVEYLAFRKSQGFNTIQVMISMNPDSVNREGDKLLDNNHDFTKPNEAYHNHVAKIIAKADSLGLLVVMSQPWLGCCEEGYGGNPNKPLLKNGIAKAKLYGQYLGRKFSKFKNLFWLMGGDNDPKKDREPLFALIEGLYETAPKHQLMTYHASPPHSSTDMFQYAPWLGFSFIYTYWREKPNDWVVPEFQPHVYEAAIREWSKSDIMPFVLGESQYEGSGIINNDMGQSHTIRRQAYWTMLSGGAGHAYGTDLWGFPKNWREIMRYPGAYQLGHFIKFFESIPWWTLSPDIKHQAVVSNYGDWSKPNWVSTAVSQDKKLMVSYIPQLQSLMIDFNYLSGNNFKVKFYDPRTGKIIKEMNITKKNAQRIESPPAEDLVLVVEGE